MRNDCICPLAERAEFRRKKHRQIRAIRGDKKTNNYCCVALFPTMGRHPHCDLRQHVQSYILNMHRVVFHGEGAVVEGISEHQTATVVTAVQVPKMVV